VSRLLLILSFSFLFCASAQACTFRFSFVFGRVTNGTLLAASGESCAVTTTRTGSKTVIKSVKITSPPKNGSASAGPIGVTYRSKPGFKGNDSFTFAVFGDGDAGTNVTATVQMSATIQ
jgi:hypothetical protein